MTGLTLDYRLEVLFDVIKEKREFTLDEVAKELNINKISVSKLIKVLAVRNSMNIYKEKKSRQMYFSLYENQVLKNQKLKVILKAFNINFKAKAFQNMSNADVDKIYQIIQKHINRNKEFFGALEEWIIYY